MNLREPTADDFPDVLRVARTMEFPEGADQLEAYVVNGEAALLMETDADDIVGFIGIKEGAYRTFRLGLKPEYRTQENVEELVDAVDAEKIDLYYEEVWLIIALQRAGFEVVDTFGLAYADGGFTLVLDRNS